MKWLDSTGRIYQLSIRGGLKDPGDRPLRMLGANMIMWLEEILCQFEGFAPEQGLLPSEKE
jgi:hypothetical protein